MFLVDSRGRCLRLRSAVTKFGKLPNWQEAREWKKDGSLVVTVETMIDGDGRSITATRTVVLGFDRADKARIVKSTIKYETETD